MSHSFISADCVVKLNLVASSIMGNMVIETPTNGYVTTSLVCLSYPQSIYGKDFGVNLICLPLSQVNFILRMNWLEFNHVHINYFDKTMMFLELE